MTDAHGQDQFTTVANRRAGYTEPVEWALKIAKRGGTLAAGEGLLLVEHYESRLAAVLAEAREDTKRLDVLEKLQERVTSIEIEHVGGEFWINEVVDDEATCLRTWRGFTIRAALDHASGEVGNG